MPRRRPRLAPPPVTAIDDLVTIRDWLRFAVSRFTAADLAYGHGTSRALDEAAFIILATLNLPIDELAPWLDARLARDERALLLDIIEKRIATRKPAAYLLGEAWIGGHRFSVDERVIVPRSFIGELLVRDGLAAVVADPGRVRSVLDLCTGSGCLAILAASAFPEARIDAVDISPAALDVAAANVAEHGLSDRIRLVCGDLFAGLDEAVYDLVLSNPPYVTAAAVAAFPPEYRAEPVIAHLGGKDGLDIVRRILAEAPRHLAPSGAIVVEVGDARAAVESAYPGLPFLWLDTEESEGEVFALQADDLAPKSRRTSAAAGSTAVGRKKRGG